MPHVVHRRVGAVGHAVLNRTEVLNALTLEMVAELDAVLREWASDPGVACVLLTGAGERGFCAGGDIVRLRDAIVGGRPEAARAFWRAEYALDARIATYPKPLVVAMDGIVMGGGVGLGCHARHRLVTERTAMAMPEVLIGLAPDVGGAYLLARAPGELGTHLALTGRRVGAADAIACGLADRAIPVELIAGLAERLSERGADEVLGELPPGRRAGAGALAAQRSWIDRAYGADSVEEILARLRASPEPEARVAAAEIERRSPLALKVTLRALRRARGFRSVAECLAQDYRVSSRFLATHDFPEGIRAAVVDKDRRPRWRPAELAAVTEAMVDGHFAPLADELDLGPVLGSAPRYEHERQLSA